jgi:uncharacterized membrane protein (DUF2068 family)
MRGAESPLGRVQDAAAAQKVVDLAVADKASVQAATDLVLAVRASARDSFGSNLPTSLVATASSLDPSALAQNAAVQQAAVPLLQAAAAASGSWWNAAAMVRGPPFSGTA